MAKNKDIIQRTKPEIVKLIREKTPFTQSEAKLALDAVLASIQDCLAKGETVKLVDFGRFYIYERPARMGRNPKTGESMEVAARKITKFAAGEPLKDAVNHRNLVKLEK